MTKAEVINMADHRDLINPTASVHFGFDDVMTETELVRRVKLVTDLIHTLGGYLQDDRDTGVTMEASDRASGETWEACTTRLWYDGHPIEQQKNKKMSLEEILEHFDRDPNQPPGINLYTPKSNLVVKYDREGEAYYLDAIEMSKNNKRVVECVHRGDMPLALGKMDLEAGHISIYHKVRPHK